MPFIRAQSSDPRERRGRGKKSTRRLPTCKGPLRHKRAGPRFAHWAEAPFRLSPFTCFTLPPRSARLVPRLTLHYNSLKRDVDVEKSVVQMSAESRAARSPRRDLVHTASASCASASASRSRLDLDHHQTLFFVVRLSLHDDDGIHSHECEQLEVPLAIPREEPECEPFVPVPGTALLTTHLLDSSRART